MRFPSRVLCGLSLHGLTGRGNAQKHTVQLLPDLVQHKESSGLSDDRKCAVSVAIKKRFLPGALKAQRLRFRMVVETLFECLSCGSQAGEVLRLKGFKCSGL